ncbi:MAG: hypothetical protein WB495_25475 [Xanthobacteraceae bacterium]
MRFEKNCLNTEPMEQSKLRLFPDGTLGFDVPAPSPEDIARRKTDQRQMPSREARLTGKTLEFALTVVGEDSEIGEKLKQAEGAMPSMMMAVSPKTPRKSSVF